MEMKYHPYGVVASFYKYYAKIVLTHSTAYNKLFERFCPENIAKSAPTREGLGIA
jgi:hypothetical protein